MTSKSQNCRRLIKIKIAKYGEAPNSHGRHENSTQLLTEESEWKRSKGRSGRKWKNKIQAINLTEIG